MSIRNNAFAEKKQQEQRIQKTEVNEWVHINRPVQMDGPQQGAQNSHRDGRQEPMIREENQEMIENGLKLLGEAGAENVQVVNAQPMQAPVMDRVRHKTVSAEKKRALLSGFAGSSVRKKGRFSADELSRGVRFFSNLEKTFEEPAQEGVEAEFQRSMGVHSALDYIYVDGMPLADFVQSQYGYGGDNVAADPQTHQNIMQTYVSMIAARANHCMNLVIPSVRDGKPDVTIRTLSVDLAPLGKKYGRKSEALRAKEEKVQRNLEETLRPQLEDKAGIEYRKVTDTVIPRLLSLEALKVNIEQAGAGEGKGYLAYKNSFDQYYRAVEKLAKAPEEKSIDTGVLWELLNSCEEAIVKAKSYIDGKKMKRARERMASEAAAALEKDSKRLIKLIYRKTDGKMSFSELYSDLEFPVNEEVHGERIEKKDILTLQGSTEPNCSPERFKKYGGASFNMTVTAEEARKYEKESGGFIVAMEVPGQPELRVLRPSLPKEVKIGRRNVPLRKTWNMFMKGLARKMVDQNGAVTEDLSLDNGSFLDLMYKMNLGTGGRYNQEQQENHWGLFLDQFILPNLRDIADENELSKFRSDMLAIAKQMNYELWDRDEQFPDNDLQRIKSMSGNREETMARLKEKFREGIRVFGYDREMSEEEQERLCEECASSIFYDADRAKQQIMLIGNLDVNSKMTPIANACSGNNKLVANFKTKLGFQQPIDQNFTKYSIESYWDEDLREKLDTFLKEYPELKFIQKRGLKEDELGMLEGYLGKLRDGEELTEAELRTLKRITEPYMSYPYHQTCGHYVDDNHILTTEAFAADDSQYVVETFTLHGAVGIYKNNIPRTEDEKKQGVQEKGINGFYNATESVPMNKVSRLKIWFKGPNNTKF